jgi:hypothetical protein
MTTEIQTETQVGETLARILARLGQTYGEDPQAEQTSSPLSPPELRPALLNMPPPKKPLKTEWQRKWLGLDVTRPEIQQAADAVEKWAGRFARQDGVGGAVVSVAERDSAATLAKTMAAPSEHGIH